MSIKEQDCIILLMKIFELYNMRDGIFMNIDVDRNPNFEKDINETTSNVIKSTEFKCQKTLLNVPHYIKHYRYCYYYYYI